MAQQSVKEYKKKVLVTELLIRAAVQNLKPDEVNILWSGGKDSTVLLHIIKRMYGKVPFRVTFGDCSFEHDEVYAFVRNLSAQWNLRLETLPYGSVRAMRQYEKSGGTNRSMLVRERIRVSKEYIASRGIKTTFSGIRWYERFHNINRFKHPYIGITMVYPILHWTYDDIWRYTKEHQVPYLSLYDKGFTHITWKLGRQTREALRRDCCSKT